MYRMPGELHYWRDSPQNILVHRKLHTPATEQISPCFCSTLSPALKLQIIPKSTHIALLKAAQKPADVLAALPIFSPLHTKTTKKTGT